jgi:hypothetical protein
MNKVFPPSSLRKRMEPTVSVNMFNNFIITSNAQMQPLKLLIT